MEAAQASLGQQLRAARKGAKLSRVALSGISGVRVETITEVEKSGSGRIGTLRRLQEALRLRFVDQPPVVEIGQWLRALRKFRRLGQRDAARLAGLTQPTVVAVERSQGRIASLASLLDTYGVPLWLTSAEIDGPPLSGRQIASNTNFELHVGDCREWLNRCVADGRLVDTVLTDPPYEAGTLLAHWDRTGIAFDPEFWRLTFRALKPGGHLLAFSWPKTAHRVTSAIEDAGFEIRDPIAWLYSSGAPWGSRDVSKAVDRRLGAVREIVGWQPPAGKTSSGASARQGLPGAHRASQYTGQVLGGPVTPEAEAWVGFATRLKPGREDIILARKPLSEPSVEQNVLRWGTGALNIDAARVNGGTRLKPHTSNGMKSLQERNQREGFRKNVPSAGREGYTWRPNEVGRYPSNVILGDGFEAQTWVNHFYVAKPVGRDRHGHPTAKPVRLLRYLARLATPPGGIILDPFAGCGSAGEAALREGFRYVGVEISPVYAEIARKRLSAIRHLPA